MTLKKINPEDLVKGKKYLVEMEYLENDESDELPLGFNNNYGYVNWLPSDQPIYTLEQTADTDLELLVNVASRLYSDYMAAVTHGSAGTFPPNSQIAREALDLITACKNALKGNQ